MPVAKMAAEPAKKKARGFAVAMEDLTARMSAKLSAKWDAKPKRSQQAEAKRRAAREMSRRLKQRADKTYAPSTLARKAAQDVTPTGADPEWMNRWAAIDRAGGIDAMAQMYKVTPYQVTAWRDQPPGSNKRLLKPKEPPPPGDQIALPPEKPLPLPPPPVEHGEEPLDETTDELGEEEDGDEGEVEDIEPPEKLPPPDDQDAFDFSAEGMEGDTLIGVDVTGILVMPPDSSEEDKRIPTSLEKEFEWLRLDHDTAQEIIDAHLSDDTDRLCDLLSKPLTELVSSWDHIPEDSIFIVTEVNDFTLGEDL